MTAVKPVLDAYLELNIVFAFSALLWFASRYVLALTSIRVSYFAQLRVLRALFICVMVSPLLAFGVSILFRTLWPGQPVALGDIAVAAYLRGDIALPAIQFEALLNMRQHWIETVLEGTSVGATFALAGLVVVAAMLAFRLVKAAMHIRTTVNNSYLWRRSPTVDVRLSDRVIVPFAVRGIFRRHVILPSHLLDKPRELQFALAHEFQHVRVHDVEWELALELLRPFFFWNPAYHIFKHQFSRLQELSCDQAVVARRRLDTVDYANCLLEYCARTVSGEGSRVLSVALVSGDKAKRVLQQRVLALAEAPVTPHSFPVLIAGFTMIFVVVLAFGSASVRQTNGWSHDRIMLSTVVNLERLEVRNSGN